MTDDSTPRRKTSPQTLARRAERIAMLPYRKQIGELQNRVALLAAGAISSKTTDRGPIDASYAEVRTAISALLEAIDLVAVNPGVGPAEDCRRALRLLLQRIPAVPGT